MFAMVHVIVSLVGETPLRNSFARYRVGDLTKCSTLAFVPKVLSIIKNGISPNDLRIVVLVPHSLITYTYSKVKDCQILEASEELIEVLKKEILHSFSRVDESQDLSIDDVGSPEDLLRAMIFRIVQVKGTFFLGNHKVRFLGSPSHAFSEIYYMLNEIHKSKGIETIHVDLSMGWNHLTLAAFLGAAAFRDLKIPGVKLDLYSSEPYTPGIVDTCGIIAKRFKPPQGVSQRPLEILNVREAQTTHEVIKYLSSLRWMSPRTLPIESVVDIYGLAREEFSRNGLGQESAELVAKFLLLLRKVFCGLSINALPYVHWNLSRIYELLSSVEGILRELRNLFRRGDYTKRVTYSLEGSEALLKYDLLPSFVYPVLDASIEVLTNMEIDEMAFADLIREEETPSMSDKFLDFMCRLYRKINLLPNAALAEKELGISKEDEIISSLEALNSRLLQEYSRRSVITDFIAHHVKWILKVDPSDKRPVRDLYPLTTLALTSRERTLKSLLEKVKEVTGSSYGGIKDLMKELMISRDPERLFNGILVAVDEVAEKKRNEYYKNLSAAMELIRSKDDLKFLNERREDPIFMERIKALLRNMIAHAGLQHFTIRDIRVRVENDKVVEFRIQYYWELFEAMDRVASLNLDVKGFPDRLKEEVGCICDLG